MKELKNVVKSIMTWIIRLFYVNILWLFFTIIGLGVFGFIPATIGLFAVVRQWILGNKNIPIRTFFWEEYRSNFKQTSLLGLPVLLIGYIFLVEINIFWNQGSTIYYVLSFIVITTFVIYAFVLLYFFPLYVHYTFSLLEYFKMAFIMGVINPIRTISLLVLVAMLYLMFLITPLIFLFIGVSTSSLVIMYLVYGKFPYTGYEESIK